MTAPEIPGSAAVIVPSKAEQAGQSQDGAAADPGQGPSKILQAAEQPVSNLKVQDEGMLLCGTALSPKFIQPQALTPSQRLHRFHAILCAGGSGSYKYG